MLQYKLGYFATSLCGHDKGKRYMIVGERGEMVGLCDGRRKLFASPKWKKKKHIQMIRSETMAEAFSGLAGSEDPDRRIREVIAGLERQKEKKQED